MSGLGGLLVFLLLHLLFVLHWPWFAAAPWSGYEDATARGIVEPWFVHTPRSIWLTRASLFIAAASLAFMRRGSLVPHALALWVGAAGGAVMVYAMTSLPALEWGWLGFGIYPLRLVLPIALGTVAGALLDRWRTTGTAGVA